MKQYLAGDEPLWRVWHEESGNILASLISTYRDFDLAEEALADAFEEALIAWRRDGPPRSPGAWLLTVARRRAIDRLRRQKTRTRLDPLLDEEKMVPATDEIVEREQFPDERLKLIFTCCHPSLAKESQVALTLKTLCGLSARQIARAFLVSEVTMNQRLVRAKRKIRLAGIPYEVPPDESLSSRLHSVLDVIYLIYSEGHTTLTGTTPARADLCEEAIHLARMLFQLLPGNDSGSLLALLLLHDARRPARADESGQMIPLERQDRTLWDQKLIEQGLSLLETSTKAGAIGPYQLEAAISACHVRARGYEDTQWIRIAGLYGSLYQLKPTPVVRLNWAVAHSYAVDPGSALKMLEGVAEQLQTYQPYHAARADMLRRCGRIDEALGAYSTAIELTDNSSERAFLQQRIDLLLRP